MRADVGAATRERSRRLAEARATIESLPDEGIRELAVLGEVPSPKGGTIRVAVKDSGNGPRIDVRHYGEAIHRPSYRGRPGVDIPAGPRKVGFWLEPSIAEALCELIARAVVEAETLDGAA